MDRRNFVRMGLAAGAVAGGAPAAGLAAPASSPGAAGILDAGVLLQQERMSAHKLTSHMLTSQYLSRIAAVDKAGPRLNAIIELNPDALKIAAEMDRERKIGKVRGPLHGIPVLLKDNIATGDRMSTSAGSLALAGVRASHDSFVAARLRAAGAVIIGKTNLSEWANMRSTHSVSGWSGRGGLTRNPYALDRNTSGSSSGSGAAIAAGLATLAVGTETDGSIVCPASVNGVVGLKPTVGTVSTAGVDLRPGRHQADIGSGQPQRHHPHRAFTGHGRSDGAQRQRRRADADGDGRRRCIRPGHEGRYRQGGRL